MEETVEKNRVKSVSELLPDLTLAIALTAIAYGLTEPKSRGLLAGLSIAVVGIGVLKIDGAVFFVGLGSILACVAIEILKIHFIDLALAGGILFVVMTLVELVYTKIRGEQTNKP